MSDRVRIIFTRSFAPYNAGERVSRAPGVADDLVRRGIARYDDAPGAALPDAAADAGVTSPPTAPAAPVEPREEDDPGADDEARRLVASGGAVDQATAREIVAQTHRHRGRRHRR